MRQIRVSVNSVYQYTVRVSQDEELETVAETCRRVMRLGNGVEPKISVGQINFVPRKVTL